jgi:chaperone required for assembly of F1-ATPase
VKRFWNAAEIGPADEAGEAAHTILLDGKPMRLPGGEVLRVASEPLASAIAGEWQAAGGDPGGEFDVDDTPLTRLAGTAQHRIAADPAPTIDALAGYAETDLLCYRATNPAALVQRQARDWQPWLDWAALTYDAPLKVTSGIAHVAQDPSSLRALRAAVAAFDPVVLAGLGVLVPALGSLVLGLAVAEGGLDPARAHELAALDEIFQTELWGRDAEAERRLAAIAADIALSARFIALARAGVPE